MPKEAEVAPCSVCGLIFHLVSSTGVLWRHGHGGSCPPCVGSGLPPVGAPRQAAPQMSPGVLDVAICHSPHSPSSSHSSSDSDVNSFDFPEVPARVVKRIPRACRPMAAAVFERCLRDVVFVGGTASWNRLLSFSNCLRMPPRTGRRHKLSSQIQAQMFDQGRTNQPHPAGLISIPRRSNKSRSPSDPDAAAARFASVKLADGDIRGAIRILGSEDSYVTPSQSAFDALLPKHPPMPVDRRPTPTVAEPPLRGEVDGVMSALHSFKPGSSAGPDGLCPQHIQDMVQSSGSLLSTTLVDFVNLVLSGASPYQLDMFFLVPTCMRLRKKMRACVP